MSRRIKINILERHGIEVFVDSDTQILAKSVFVRDGCFQFDWVDVTDWNQSQLMQWLGY